jgi:hypothetical protein
MGGAEVGELVEALWIGVGGEVRVDDLYEYEHAFLADRGNKIANT